MWVELKRAGCCVVALRGSDVKLFQQLINTTLCPAFLRKFVCQPLCCVPLLTTNFLSKSCPRRRIPCWLLTNAAVTSVVTNFRCHRLIAKVNKYKHSDTEKFYLQSVWGKTRYFKHQKHHNLWKNNKVRGDQKCTFLHFLPHLQKFWILNFPR